MTAIFVAMAICAAYFYFLCGARIRRRFLNDPDFRGVSCPLRQAIGVGLAVFWPIGFILPDRKNPPQSG